MKNKLVLFLALAISFVFAAQAVTLNLSLVLTNREAKGIAYATKQINQIRTNQVPPLPALTQAEFAEKCIRETLSVLADRAIQAEREDLARRYESATPTKQAQVDAIIPP